jgi:hypothetical protein
VRLIIRITTPETRSDLAHEYLLHVIDRIGESFGSHR